MSEKFFDGYVAGRKGSTRGVKISCNRTLTEFAHWRTNLDTLTVNARGAADLTPAYEIFRRFLERFRQHTAYVDELLKQDKFKFTGDDRF